MTESEFKTTPFVYGMKVLYKGEKHKVISVDFYGLIAIKIDGKSQWFHFSEVELIKE
jgi:hypothetical protein